MLNIGNGTPTFLKYAISGVIMYIWESKTLRRINLNKVTHFSVLVCLSVSFVFEMLCIRSYSPKTQILINILAEVRSVCSDLPRSQANQ